MACKSISVNLVQSTPVQVDMVKSRPVRIEMKASGPIGPIGPIGPVGPSAEDIIMTAPTTHGISALKVIRGIGNGVGDYADNDTLSHLNGIVGISITAAAAGGTFKVMALGRLTDSAFNWNLGSSVFLGKNGAMTQDASVAMGAFLNIVGTPVAGNSLLVRVLSSITL